MRALAIGLLVAALALGASASGGVHDRRRFELDEHTGPHYTFEQYCADFGKQYHDNQKHFRARLFAKNVAKIVRHNSDRRHSWKMGVNRFTDMTDAEFKRFVSRGVVSLSEKLGLTSRTFNEAIDLPRNARIGSDLPTAVDWRTHNPPVITPVKDQGGCGSCWAHAGAESIESFVALNGGAAAMVPLSRQSLVDCVPNPDDCGGFGGCEGATAELAFTYVQNKGIATESAYPYTGQDGTCNENVQKVAWVDGFVLLPRNNQSAVMTAVANIGPMAINCDANSWAAYSSGVFTGCPTDNIDINHVIQLVGYGTDPTGGDYWLVRNSWSAGWGENGYIRIARSNACATDNKPQDGVGCNGGPASVTVCDSCGLTYDVSYPTGAHTSD